MKISLIGSGSWATAIERVIRNHGIDIYWWKRRDGRPITEAISNSNDILLAVPSPFLHSLLKDLPANAFDGKNIISAIKGYIPETHQPVSTYLKEHFHITDDRLCVIGGPSHAEEVEQNQMASLTVASSNRELAKKVCSMLRSNVMRCTPSSDVHRLERVATLKNIYAVAVGICRGIGGGDNCTGMLVSSILREVSRAMKTDENAIADLLATCYSEHSRNLTLGRMIGQGVDVQTALEQMPMIPEGYYAAQSFEQLREGAKLPIAQTVCDILLGGSPTDQILSFE